MAQPTEVEVTITPEGEVQLKVKGVQGRACLDLTKALEEELGVVKERKLTPDYYQQAQGQQQRRGTQ